MARRLPPALENEAMIIIADKSCRRRQDVAFNIWDQMGPHFSHRWMCYFAVSPGSVVWEGLPPGRPPHYSMMRNWDVS